MRKFFIASQLLFQLLFSKLLASILSFLVTNPPNDLAIIDVAKKISIALKNETEWEIFGMHLLDTTDKQDLSSIQQQEKGNPLEDKCKSLLELWNKKTREPKWEQVVQALAKINLNELSAKLQRALRIEQPQNTFTNDGSQQQWLQQGDLKFTLSYCYIICICMIATYAHS